MQSQEKIALDIVLLPPEDISELARNLSKAVIPPENMRPLRLGKNDYLPHISILMGTTSAENIKSIKNKIEQITKKYLPLKITFTHIEEPDKFPYLAIQKTKELINLQNEIAEVVSLDYDADKTMFVDPDIADAYIDWVNNFRKNCLGEEKFNPHITLGLGDSSKCKVDFPIQTNVDTIAICQLGYGCSCRKVFEKLRYKKSPEKSMKFSGD